MVHYTGGPIGAVSSLIDVAVDYGTGKDIGEHALVIIQDEPSNAEIASNTPAQISAEAANNPYLANSYLANAGATKLPNSASSYIAFNFILAQETATKTSGYAGQTSGMSAIPVTR